MNTVFDELKQFILKEITDEIEEFDKVLYYNLVENKKYLIVYHKYNTPNLITLIYKKMGHFLNKTTINTYL